MTQVTKVQLSSSGFLFGYYLINPATASQTLTMKCSSNSTSRMELVSAVYSGTNQTSQPDVFATTTVTAATSITKNVTTTVDNDWLSAGFLTDTAAVFTAGSNTTIRANALSSRITAITDSNTSETPVGSYSQAMSWTGAAHASELVMAIKPFVAAAAATPMTFSWINDE